MRAWKLVLYSRVLAPSPLSCIRFFTRSSGCTNTVAPILEEDRSRVQGRVSPDYLPVPTGTWQRGVTKRQGCPVINQVFRRLVATCVSLRRGQEPWV